MLRLITINTIAFTYLTTTGQNIIPGYGGIKNVRKGGQGTRNNKINLTRTRRANEEEQGNSHRETIHKETNRKPKIESVYLNRNVFDT